MADIRFTFGTQNSMALLEKIDRMEIQLAELRSKQDVDRRRLDELEPARIHINAIRKPLME